MSNDTRGATTQASAPEQPKKVLPHERKPTYRLLVNPHGGLVTFETPKDDERFEDLLITQRPPKVKPQNWYREAEPHELAAYMERTGEFFHEDDRAEWERTSKSPAAKAFRTAKTKAEATEKLAGLVTNAR